MLVPFLRSLRSKKADGSKTGQLSGIWVLKRCSYRFLVYFTVRGKKAVVLTNCTLAVVRFIYSEKATKFYEISNVDLSYVTPDWWRFHEILRSSQNI